MGQFAAVLRQRAEGDGELLELFLRQADQSAFETLVRRHGPMVFGVCCRVLGNTHDAEDAFQATFLVLTHKAATVRPRSRVGNWLYGVAYRTALEAKRAIVRRRAKEARAVPRTAPSEDNNDDLRAVLDQELARLPNKYREVIVLCDLEGQQRKEVARRLRCPEGTVASRLARARSMLAKRLSRHGLVLAGGLLPGLLTKNVASACVPSSLVTTTIQAANAFAVGQTAALGMISPRVVALAQGVMKTMLLTKLKIGLVVLLTLSMLGCFASVESGSTLRSG